VITNNLNVANILADNPDCEVIVAGGVLRRATAASSARLRWNLSGSSRWISA
jgi:DeoR/GlpR family transcriptional regulator of sugar metabolism